MASTGMTSYERVYNALFQTSTCTEVWASALKAMKEVKIERVEFRLSTTEDTATAVAQFKFSAEFTWNGDSLSSSDVSARNFLTREMIMKVVDIHFGPDKDVKTFNCNTDVVRTGGQVSRKTAHGREKEHQCDFEDFVMDKFRKEAEDELKAATTRLRKEAHAMMETDGFKKAKREALIGFCKETLTRALLPWHEMEQSVLEEAWDQFICTAIMKN